jgi:transglutaminase-like putative cysteine protease
MKIDREHVWFILPQALAVAALVPRLPYWISAFWAVCAGLRLFGREAWLAQWLRLTLAGLAIAGVVVEYHTIFGPLGGVALLVCMSALKLLETQTARDRALMALIGYFLLMTPLIQGQSLPLAIYLLGVATLLTASLIGIQTTSHLSPWRRLGIAARLLAQALPLAVFLFLLFPRIPAPFGGLMQTQSGQTGLSDSMQPGSVSELIQSDAVAFRVEFEGTPPRPTDLYWRGPVLWAFDGRTWRSDHIASVTKIQSRGLGRFVKYTVTLEPHQQRWLFTLGLPLQAPDIESILTDDLQWLTPRPIQTRISYHHVAMLDYRLETELTPSLRALGLELPEGYNPRTRQLVESWQARGLSGPALVDAALTTFREEAFYYTLRPPRLGVHSVDEFLFDSRRGFCEHYASAFVIMMRMAGLPARVVTGYQGGERNALGDYWLVRQRDAHAWAEVWLAGEGWRRVDPTAAVAPERVERGIGAALPLDERPVTSWDSSLMRPIVQTWDMINTQWSRWVLGYDHARQQQFLSTLHPLLTTLKGMLWALMVGIGILLALLFWSLLPRTRKDPVDELVKLNRQFRTRLRRAGLDTPAQEGPLDLARRVGAWRPDLADQTRAIMDLYIAMRYGQPVAGGLATLRARIHRFKP